MSIWAVVPVKPFLRGKSRLSTVVNRENRVALNRCLLQNTLEILVSINEIEQVLVISRDPQVLAVARSYQARTIQEAGSPRLNQALERATLFARQHTVHGVLIIPADLPLINTFDIGHMLDLAGDHEGIVIAPDRHRRGTNALYVSPPGVIPYEFGFDSFQKHCMSAKRMGLDLHIAEFPALALDLDLPDDLKLVKQQMQYLRFDDPLSNPLNMESRESPDYTENGDFRGTHPCLDQLLE